nr:MAG TPA: hypothetical protein [Caudoviricetes sp.]
MAKAVLVMDMPKRCDECNLFLMIKQKNLGLCLAGPPSGETNIEYNPKHEESWRPDFCPLRELPEQEHNDNEYDEYSDGWDAGWNACLNEITR